MGELQVIVVRELTGSVVAVTQKQLEAWGISFAQALHEAVNNMNMLSFPPITNELRIGGTAKKGATDGEVHAGRKSLPTQTVAASGKKARGRGEAEAAAGPSPGPTTGADQKPWPNTFKNPTGEEKK